MQPRIRKLVLTAHVAFSVGWLGAVVAYLAPALVGLTSSDVERVRACHLTMELIGWFVIVPLALGCLATGLVQSLVTEWWLVRHYWIVTKLILAVVGATILLLHMNGTVGSLPSLSREALADESTGHLKKHLVMHAMGGVVILLAATVLSIYKPWGKTRYGKRKAA